MPLHHLPCIEVQHKHLGLAIRANAGVDHRRGHSLGGATLALSRPVDVYAHGFALELHAKTLDFRQAHDEVELVQVDHDERHPLNKTGADVHEQCHLPLGFLERAIAVHDSEESVGRHMHLETMPLHVARVDEGLASTRVV